MTATLESHLERIERDGYTIVEDAFDPEWANALTLDLERLEEKLSISPSKNEFEGRHTWRIYNLLAHDELYQRIPIHPPVLSLVDRVLDEGCLISSLSSISIGPGETPQPIHSDDQLLPIAKPHDAVICNSMWALTDFTEANGATRIIPGSHKADANPIYGESYESVAAEMRRGSVLIWHGSLWHGGGANKTKQRRIGIAMNYCAGFLRQQENQQLGIPLEQARRFPERLRELVGYGVYRNLIGHIDKHSPSELLDGDGKLRIVWDV